MLQDYRKNAQDEYLELLRIELQIRLAKRARDLELRNASHSERQLESQVAKKELQEHQHKADISRIAFAEYNNLANSALKDMVDEQSLFRLQLIREEFELLVPDERYHFFNLFL